MKIQSGKSALAIRLIILSILALLLLDAIPSRAQDYGNITPPPPRPRRAYSTVDNYLRTHGGASMQTEATPQRRRRAYTTVDSYVKTSPHSSKHRRAYETVDHFSGTTGDAKKPQHRKSSASTAVHESPKVQDSDAVQVPVSSESKLKQPVKLNKSDTQSESKNESKSPVQHEASYELSDDVTGSLTATASVGKFKSLYPRTKLAPPDEKVFDVPAGKLGVIPPPQMPLAPTSLGGLELSSNSRQHR